MLCYVSCAADREIRLLRLDPDGGGVEDVDRISVPGADGDPTSMPLAVSPDRRFLYAALRTEPFTVASFAIARDTARLSLLGTASLPDSMPYIATDRSGRWLLSASYPGNKVAVSPIGDNGVAGAACQVLDTPPKAHFIRQHPNGCVYVPCLGGDCILRFNFDAQQGVLSPVEPDRVTTRPRAGPRHLAFHPNGTIVYAINELDGTLNVYAVEPGVGTLRQLQSVAVTPPDFAGTPSAADLHMTPNARFLYGSERGSNTIAAFRVDPSNGLLASIGSFATESGPRGFALDPTGRFLLAAGQRSHRISLYAIAPDTGALRKVAEHATGRNPNWIEFVATV